jgi:Phosphotransferase enzyme family
MKLPVLPEQVSAEWLTQALNERYPKVTVERARVLDVMAGTSTKIRVQVDFDAAGRDAGLPPRLIVKGGFEAHSPSMAPMYLTEMRFYRDVQPHVDLPSPRCYYAGTDASSHQSIVILEDLTARNATFLHAQRPQRPEEVARRLSAMARYHAQTWNSPQFGAGGRFDWIGGRHEGWSVVYQQRYLEEGVWRGCVESPRGAAVSTALHDGLWMASALRELGQYHRGQPVCLCHGDTHLGNLYVDADGSPGFFDAQVARGPWQLEVTYHIICALDLQDRPRHERALLQHYLDELRRHGVDAPTAAQAWEAHRREIVYGLFIFLINETRFQTEAVNTAYAARFGAAALDHGTRRLIGSS